MEIEQAILTAIQYETRVRDVYRSAADRIRDATGRKVLGLLAAEEQGHLDFLRSQLAEWKDTGRVSPKRLQTVVPAGDRLREGIQKLESRAEGTDRSREIEILDGALRVEMETSEFYRGVVSALGAEGQALFEPFLEIEEGHLGIVQAEIDNLRGLGFWFDFQEFDLEAG